MIRLMITLLISVPLLFAAGCSKEVAGGAVLGVGAAGAAYEYSNKKALDDLEEDLRAGKISPDEYQRRKKDIEDKSLLY